ncbi:hypothetical protein PR202_gb08244 [Eleusine coracana subsp. coracana]|uniref:eIF-(iso)4F 25 kDa subunit n=1 Tax=Eleusine coracana subsp. coracana TaxID=191504 RepID=A0AAV5EF89_ELECO|nr:hypothetical protein PR202_gb08244 [Eleusine coracana subsp. coracana]
MAEVEVAAPAAATTPEVQAATEGTGSAEAKGPHKLHRQWTFWYDIQSKPKPGAAWGTSLKKAYTFDTVEEFWSLYDQVFRPSKLQGTADFHLFKAGVEPKWEDPECANGGKWTVPCSRKPTFETMWLETVQHHYYYFLSDEVIRRFSICLMALIGEQFDETEDICGIVASVRPRGDKLALWTRTASNEAVQVNIGKKWKDVIDYNDKITYTFHLKRY